MTPDLSKDIQCHVWPYFSKLSNQQIRHQATHKVGCQASDCIWSLYSFSWGLYGYVWVNMMETCRNVLYLSDRPLHSDLSPWVILDTGYLLKQRVLQNWNHTINRAAFVCLSVCLSVCSLSPPRSFDRSSPNLVGVCRWTSELPLRGSFSKTSTTRRVNGSLSLSTILYMCQPHSTQLQKATLLLLHLIRLKGTFCCIDGWWVYVGGSRNCLLDG